jgi:hypothetical protein
LFSRCCGKKKDTVNLTNLNQVGTAEPSETTSLRRGNTIFKVSESFSSNIYEEINVENLKREYEKTQADLQSYTDEI